MSVGKGSVGQGSVGAGFYDIDERIIYFIKNAPVQNFGDYLPEIFSKDLLGHPRVDADLFRLVGSVIDDRWVRQDLRKVNGHVSGLIAFWGCGKRDATPLSPEIQSHCLFFGARGTLTRDALGLPADTVLGDPGILAPLFHAPTVHPQTNGRTICIPHIHDTRSQEELLALSGADVLVHPEIEASESAMRDILDRIASADFVLSASLHGAIIACAYGRPFAFWDNGHLDVPFKWDDFASSIAVPARFAKSLADGQKLHSELVPLIKVPPLAPILENCPFTPQPAALLRALAYDQPAEADVLLKAAAIVEKITTGRVETEYQLYDASRQNRSHRSATPRLAKKWLGLSARTTKRSLKKIMGRA